VSSARSNPRRDWPPAALVGLSLGVVVTAVSGLALWQIADPLGAGGVWGVPPMAVARAEAANELLERAWPIRDPALLLLARREVERELALSPASGAGWLRLAVIERSLAGELNERAFQALAHSYATAPLDQRLLGRRVRFAYDNWGALSPSLRRLTLDQIEFGWRDAGQRQALRQTLPLVEDPGGQLALRAKLVSLARMDRIERRRQRALETAAPP